MTAVLCGNDGIALGVMRATYEAGRAAPADVSIVGFDDEPYARFYTPAPTSVRQDFRALGRVAFVELLSLVGSNRSIEHVDLPRAELVIRESAGTPPRDRTRPGSASRAQRPRAGGAAAAAGSRAKAHAGSVEEVHFFACGGSAVDWASLGFGVAALVLALASIGCVLAVGASRPPTAPTDLWYLSVRPPRGGTCCWRARCSWPRSW